MSFRTAWLAFALTAVAGALTTGCGDVCSEAEDRIEGCGSAVSEASEEEECTGVVECAAECINDASCEAIRGADPEGANALAGCLTACKP